MENHILAADIGGTNSRFAHFIATEREGLALNRTQWLKTKDASSFKHLLEQLFEGGFPVSPSGIDISVVAVAGPVERGVYSKPPFIPWEIDVSNAQGDYRLADCILINDFVAQAYACRSPVGEKAEQVLDGRIVPDATAAVIGAGTGLGMAALAPDGKGDFIPVSSEGGHANFPFVSKEEADFRDFLLRYVHEEYVTGNTVVSGKGLSLLHYFLTDEKLEPKDVAARFSPDSATLNWASRFYGRACRNYALTTLSLGGLYVAGGIAAQSPLLVRHKSFEKEFRSSTTMSHILGQIPVFLITDQESGLWGAAFLGLQRLREDNKGGINAGKG